MNAGLTFILGLTLTGILPALAIAGVTPVCIFLSPLIGAVAAGVAVECEIGLGGTMILWFVLVAVILNIIALASLLRRRSFPAWQTGGWSLATVAVLLLVLAIPLTGMRAHEVGYDGAIIWTTHALLISGGHKTLVSGLQNPAYLAANPDYPPLVPAVSALGFSFAGRSVLILGSELTALLNAAAVGVYRGWRRDGASTFRTPRAFAVDCLRRACMPGRLLRRRGLHPCGELQSGR